LICLSFQYDAVPVVDVRTSILSRRLAALPADSAERDAVQRKLADAYHVNFPILFLYMNVNFQFFFYSNEMLFLSQLIKLLNNHS
jgi:hypothetical protein